MGWFMTQREILRSITVSLAERSYPILIGCGLIADLRLHLQNTLKKLSHVLVVIDENVAQRFGDSIQAALVQGDGYSPLRVSYYVVPSGEKSKSIEQLGQIWEFMSAENCDRGSVVVAIGGGVVGDLAGFAAASFARGLRFVQVPTTLLAQVDSSVGGKTGINLSRAKNMVGAFWQPSLVLIDFDTMTALPTREFNSGLAEVVKYGMILDADFFEWLEANVAAIRSRSLDALAHIVARSCELKAGVVAADERETTGLRAILNYGHTFGHAIEALSGYGNYLHGEAVSIGMTMAAKLACSLGMIDESVVARQSALLQALDLPIDPPAIPFDLFWATMQKDKKVQHGKLTFILPDRIGNVRGTEGVELQQVKVVLR
jgi:3-dehydroquinate synthase